MVLLLFISFDSSVVSQCTLALQNSKRPDLQNLSSISHSSLETLFSLSSRERTRPCCGCVKECAPPIPPPLASHSPTSLLQLINSYQCQHRTPDKMSQIIKSLGAVAAIKSSVAPFLSTVIWYVSRFLFRPENPNQIISAQRFCCNCFKI